jgi:MFS family permease
MDSNILKREQALGMTTLIYFIGTSVGPVIAGIFMQANQVFVKDISSGESFPASQSYNLIFLTGTLLSPISIVLAGVIKKGQQSCGKVYVYSISIDLDIAKEQ